MKGNLDAKTERCKEMQKPSFPSYSFASLRLYITFFGVLALVNCTAPSLAPAAPAMGETVQVEGLALPDGFSAEVLVEGLQGPTQMIVGPTGRLWVAQLAGDENAGDGQVVAVDLATGEQTILLDGLVKPVGIALLDSHLWIMARNDLLQAAIDAGDQVGAVEPVLAGLPFNGRSNGVLTVTPTGKLLYETSGARNGNAAALGRQPCGNWTQRIRTSRKPLRQG
jgi:glucose/arabinose dehydrogenase